MRRERGWEVSVVGRAGIIDTASVTGQLSLPSPWAIIHANPWRQNILTPGYSPWHLQQCWEQQDIPVRHPSRAANTRAHISEILEYRVIGGHSLDPQTVYIHFLITLETLIADLHAAAPQAGGTVLGPLIFDLMTDEDVWHDASLWRAVPVLLPSVQVEVCWSCE